MQHPDYNTIVKLANRSIVAFMAAITTAGCTASPEPTTDTTASSGIIESGGLLFNGIGVNGINLNGIGVNGIGINGIGINSLYLNGIGVNGIGVNGIGIVDVPLSGLNGESLVVSGQGSIGLRVNQLPTAGSTITALTIGDASLAQTGEDGVGLSGYGLDGVRINGLYLSGTAADTLVVNGAGLTQTALDGLEINGAGSNGIHVTDINGAASRLSSQQEQALDRMLLHLVGCALPQRTSISIIIDDGITKVYEGRRGFAPEWAYGALSTSGEENVRSCLLSSAGVYEHAAFPSAQEEVLETVLTHLVGCALPAGHSVTIVSSNGLPKEYAGVRGFAPEWEFGALSQTGSENVRACLDSVEGRVSHLALNPEQENRLTVLLRYLIQCALPAGDSVTVYASNGTPIQFPGALGLAPEWATGPLSSMGQRLVSACLAARTNANGQTVRISIRGAGIDTTPVERAVYEQHEGVFWGNFFGSNPHINTCKADGAGISGRVCTEDGCGFTNAGSCADICATKDAVDGHYTDCAGDDAVLNIFLSITDDVAFGKNHSCFRKDDGSLWCWGENTGGKLGDGSETSRLAPAPVTALGNGVDEVAAGANHTCARKDDGSVWCWGENNEGQLGSGSLASQALDPEQVSVIGNDVASLAVGSQHACGLKTDGSLWCWGDNFYGQLGDSTTTSQNAPVQVESLGMDVAAISLGDCAQHTCAVTNEGAAWCWGWNDAGQLGNGTVQTSALPAQVTHDSLGNEFTDVTDLCTGWMHTCARKADGSVWCWGSNDRGRLGNPHLTSTVETQPVRVALRGAVVHGGLTCAMDHSCAIKTDGSVWCWGGNEHGQLGNGTITPASPAAAVGSPTPGQVIGLPAAAVRVSADSSHTCATLADSSLYCWGQNNNNLIYDGPSSATPVLFDMPSFDTYAPAGVSVSFGVATADLRWAAHQAAGLAHYEIVRNGQLVQTVAAGSQHALDSNLGAGTYCYQLRAVLTDGTASAFSQEICGAID